MSDPVSLEEARQRRAAALADIAGSSGGGHGGGMSELERRVGALEKQVAVVETKADTLIANGREMGVDIKSLGKALGDLTGRVSQLPSTWTMAGWFVTVSIALTGLVFTIARAMK